jgi:hypothetical protein
MIPKVALIGVIGRKFPVFQRFAIQLAAIPDSSMVYAGGATLIQTGNALANFEPFSYAFRATLAETRFSPNESALIGPRFSDASLVTAAWIITARGLGTLEGDQR